MGRPKRLYPLGKYHLRTPKETDKNKAYPIELEVTDEEKVIKLLKSMNLMNQSWKKMI